MSSYQEEIKYAGYALAEYIREYNDARGAKTKIKPTPKIAKDLIKLSKANIDTSGGTLRAVVHYAEMRLNS